jgi:Phosphoglycerate kinase
MTVAPWQTAGARRPERAVLAWAARPRSPPIPSARSAVDPYGPGRVRHAGEPAFQPGRDEQGWRDPFAEELASLADLYVGDGFGAVHRRHASVYGVAARLPTPPGTLSSRDGRAARLTGDIRRPYVWCWWCEGGRQAAWRRRPARRRIRITLPGATAVAALFWPRDRFPRHSDRARRLGSARRSDPDLLRPDGRPARVQDRGVRHGERMARHAVMVAA